jgi:glycosyltransferase involved in cell wall biosynthesis
MEVFKISESTMVMLYAGRISQEKGVLELPEIYNKLKLTNPDLLMVVAGIGPALDQLKNEMPDAKYLGWVEQKNLPELYSSSDLLILPSKFDTFGNAVIEALSCGLPVVAYNSKGSKDIIEHGESGFLAHTIAEMVSYSELYFSDKKKHQVFRNAAKASSKQYNSNVIIADFIESIGISI